MLLLTYQRFFYSFAMAVFSTLCNFLIHHGSGKLCVLIFMICSFVFDVRSKLIYCKVLFVCTANVIEMIPGPLLDRMEVIDLSGYVTDEKMHIARDYLVKKTCRDCGIKPDMLI